MLSFLTTALLSALEGLTEFLPISSTGHLILASHIMGLAADNRLEAFEIFIQAGAISAVIIIYAKKLWQNFNLWRKILVGFIPTGILGLFFSRYLSQLLTNTGLVLAMLLAGGLFFLVWDRIARRFKVSAKALEQVTYRQAIAIGLAQSIAMIPGVSRSAASIFGGLIVGLEKEVAVEFSFLLAIPTIFAASALAIIKNRSILDKDDFLLFSIGFFIALATAWWAIRFFLGYLKKHSFAVFGWYRIILASLYALLIK